jgi:predicted Zn-dependent protease
MNQRIERIGFAVFVAMWLAAGAASSAQDATEERAATGAEAMRASRFEEAATIYADLVAARPNDAGLLLNLGMARYMSGHAEQAVAPLQKASRLNPSLAPASMFLGASLVDLGRLEEALAPLQKAVAAMPSNVDAHELLARTQLGLARYANAASEYRILTTLEPNDPKGWYGLVKTYQGVSESTLAALQQEAPDSPLLQLLIADVAVTQEKLPAALAIYRRVLASNPPVGGIHEAIAALYERAGKPEWAAAERAKAGRRTAEDCASRVAECAFLEGRFGDALEAAAKAPSTVGRYWAIRSANALATEAFSRLDALPPSLELHLIRAEIAGSRNQNPEAVREVRAALAMAPGSRDIEIALAEALLRAHDLDEALPLLERLIAQGLPEPNLLLMYGDALVEHQELDKGIAVLARAARAEPSLIAARASLGRAFVQAGRYDEAVPLLEAAAADDENGDVHYQLARAYQALQRADDARRAMAEYQKRHQPENTDSPGDTKDEALTPP